MEVATMSSSFAVHKRVLSLPTPSLSVSSSRAQAACPPRVSLSTSFVSTFPGGSVCGEALGQKIRPKSLNPATVSRSKGKRGVVTM
ncbi:hypothetical protein CRG98_041490, partial [Punica granatum]